MNANSNIPQLSPERLEQMINLALSHAQDQKPASILTRGSWSLLDWFRRPALIPVPVRAFAVVTIMAVAAMHLMPGTPVQHTPEKHIADTDVYTDVSDYMMYDLLDQLS